MARYGARNSKFALFDDQTPDTDSTKLPKYLPAKTFGALNKVSDSPNFNEGSMYGDDSLSLYEKAFKDGTVDAESVFLPVEDAASILGASHDEEHGLAHGDDDAAPYIGYGFTTTHLGKNGRFYQVVFYPKLKASTVAESYDTRGDNITFATDKMSFHWESPACRKFKIIKDFTSEAEAKSYLDKLFDGSAAVPGLTAPASAG